MLEEILSRLPIKGATKIGGVPFADHLVVVGNEGKIDTSLIPGLGDLDLSATGITFDSTYDDFSATRPNTLRTPAPTEVQAAIEGLDSTKLSISQLFLDIDAGNRATAFNNIKQSATTSVSGVVALASNAETLAGVNDTKAITPVAVASSYLKLAGGTVTGVINVPTPSVPANVNQVVNQQYVTAAVTAASILQIISPGINWVNTSGNNATALRGVMNRPYATPAAALAAAEPGDTLVVLPGTYSISSSLLKNGVTWVLYPGVVFQHDGTSIGMFDDEGTALAASVLGYGTFSSVGANKPIVSLTGQSTVTIKALSITSNGSTAVYSGFASELRLDVASITAWDAYALYISTGTNVITCDTITYNYVSTGPTRAINIVGGTTTLNIRSLVSDKGGIYMTAGSLLLLGDTIDSVGTAVHCAGGIINSYTKIMKNTDIVGTPVFSAAGTSEVKINQAVLTNTGTDVLSNAIALYGTPIVVIKDSELTSGANATDSISGTVPTTVSIRGFITANANPTSTVAIAGGIFETI